jgi:hypothetical protein
MAALVLLASISGAAADVTGKWTGSLSGTGSDGTPRTDGAVLMLTQKDKTVTGSVGGSETDQHKITSGTVNDDKVTITATTPNGREIRLELAVAGEEMKGTLFVGEQKAEIAVKRTK